MTKRLVTISDSENGRYVVMHPDNIVMVIQEQRHLNATVVMKDKHTVDIPANFVATFVRMWQQCLGETES